MFSACSPALRARANFSQELPGVNSEIVVIIPLELDGVLPDALGGNRSGGWLEHGQSPRREFRWFSRFAPCLIPLLVAHGAGAGIAEENEGIMRNVAVGPLDIHAATRGEIHLYGLGICGRCGRLKRGLHDFSIAYGTAVIPELR